MKDSYCDMDLSFFLGQSVDQICFGSYQIQFNFSKGASLSAESRVILNTSSGAFEFNQPYKHAGELLTLLEAEIAKAETEQNGDLLLGFSSGCTLRILNDNGRYESYQIRNGQASIVV
jgi:Family of unknown function (DUF6188)